MNRGQRLYEALRDVSKKQVPRFLSKKPEADTSVNTIDNICMFQAFEWNVPADQKHWLRLESVLEELKDIGLDNVWIPPACKAANPRGNGYDVYDLYDLGEFNQ